MELILLIAICLTIWRIIKFLAAITAVQPRPLRDDRYWEDVAISTSARVSEKRKASAAAPINSAEIIVKDESSFWIPPGKTIWVNGYRIAVGGLYVGTGLRGLNELRKTEPALIDPKLPIDRARIDRIGEDVPYWPFYSELPPASRAGYLEWLSGGLQDSQVHVAYPFLFFYGLERRLLGDGKPFQHEKGELEFMHRKVIELLKLYGKSDSFERYARSFLEIIEVSRDKDNLYKTSAPMDKMGESLPARTLVVISQCASSGQPLPAEWALSWVMCHPEVRLRTPARRCKEEFRDLFLARYKNEFRGGIEVRPGKGQLVLPYRPASASFGGPLSIQTSLPKVPVVQRVPAQLADLVERCTDELDAYSRYIANRTKEERGFASIALLPKELVTTHQGHAGSEFRSLFEEMLKNKDLAVVSGEAVVDRWSKEHKPSKADCVLLSQLLEKWNYGIEPDVRFGGPPIRRDSKVVLFRLQAGAPSTPSPEYAMATLLLHLGVTVAVADGTLSSEEERWLERQIEVALRMSESERGRLKAHLRWLCVEAPTLSGLAKRVEPLTKTQRSQLAQSVIGLSGADGYVHAEEIEALAMIYSVLEIPSEQLYVDLHALSLPDSREADGLATVEELSLPESTKADGLAAVEELSLPESTKADGLATVQELSLPESTKADGLATVEELSLPEFTKADGIATVEERNPYLPESKEADELVTVQERDPLEKSYWIPKAKNRTKLSGFKLDMNKVNAKLVETAAVSAMLTSIFTESDPVQSPAPSYSVDTKDVGGLDARHSKLLMALVDNAQWERSAVEDLTASLNLLTDGALEMINEASFDMVGEALWEGDDPIRINLTVAKEMMTCQTTG